jgi:hypothetical protein
MGTKVKEKNREVSELVKQINVLNRDWIKAGCWSIVTETERTRANGTKYLQQVERPIELQKRKKEKKPARLIGHMPDSANTAIRVRGKPGTKERIEALAAHYQGTEEISPFTVSELDEVAALALIMSHLVPKEDGSERSELVDSLCGLSHNFEEPDLDIRSDV